MRKNRKKYFKHLEKKFRIINNCSHAVYKEYGTSYSDIDGSLEIITSWACKQCKGYFIDSLDGRGFLIPSDCDLGAFDIEKMFPWFKRVHAPYLDDIRMGCEV